MFIEDIKSMEDMELCSKPKTVNFTFLNVAMFCFNDIFANDWPTLNQLHEEATWNSFRFAGGLVKVNLGNVFVLYECFVNGTVAISSGVQK